MSIVTAYKLGYTRRVTAAAGVPDVTAVAEHIERAVEYIETAYPDAQMLDRGPILRNMRRWARRLREAAPEQRAVPDCGYCDPATAKDYQSGRHAMQVAKGRVPVEQQGAGDDLVEEALQYFERAGDAGDRKYVAAIRAALARWEAKP